MTSGAGRGAMFGRFRLEEPVGKGGMGEVWRAVDTRLERQVAIKILPPALGLDPERVARFEREAKSLAALSHPGIAQVYEVGEGPDVMVGGRPAAVRFLAIELIRGKTLADVIGERAPLPAAEAMQIGLEVAQALAAAHDKNIVHRDLKPGNVMLAEDGRVKLLDFGLARRRGGTETAIGDDDSTNVDLTAAGAMVGTAPYMSPEQARGEPADPRSDIWACGCLLYEMITGRRAFDGPTRRETRRAILEKPVPRLDDGRPGLPVELVDLVADCLTKDPDRRVGTARELALRLESIVTPAESSAPSAPPEPELILTAGQKLLLIASLILLSTGGILRWLARSEASSELEPVKTGASRLVEWSDGPFDDLELATSPSGDRSVIVRETDGATDLWLAASGQAARALTRDRATESAPSFTPAGDAVYFLRFEPPAPLELWRLDLATDRAEVIASGIAGFSLSNDGRRAVIDDGRLAFLDLATRKLIAWRSPSAGESFDSPRWSPDGTWIAWLARGASGWRLELAPADSGREPEVLWEGDSAGMPRLTWSRSRLDLYFTAGAATGQSLYVAEAPGGTIRLLARHLRRPSTLAATTDSRLILGLEASDGRRRIFHLLFDGV